MSNDAAIYTDYRGRSRAPRTDSERRMAAQQAEAQKALSGGCPCCGRPVRRNLSMRGWLQCSQFGAPSFRADPKSPPCGWQGFTG